MQGQGGRGIEFLFFLYRKFKIFSPKMFCLVQEENDGTHFAPGGAGFSLAWPPAAKVATRKTGRALLRNFTAAIPLISTAGNGTNNGWEDDNGGGLEDIAAMQAIHLMMLQHMCAHTPSFGYVHVLQAAVQQSSSQRAVSRRNVRFETSMAKTRWWIAATARSCSFHPGRRTPTSASRGCGEQARSSSQLNGEAARWHRPCGCCPSGEGSLASPSRGPSCARRRGARRWR